MKHMKASISHRFLTKEERAILAEETKQSPYIGFIHESVWQHFGKMFVIDRDQAVLGACATIALRGWIKIGPLIILSRAQGKGLGKQLLTRVVSASGKQNLYIGTPNPKVMHMARTLEFQQVNYLQLPGPVKYYLLHYLFERISGDYIFSSLRKKLRSKNWGYAFFIKYASKQ